MNQYKVYVCGVKPYANGEVIKGEDAKNAAEIVSYYLTGVQLVDYIGSIKGCAGLDIHVYQDVKGWIYNVHRNVEVVNNCLACHEPYELPDGVGVLEMEYDGTYDDYRNAPDMLRCDDKLYVKSGMNSDNRRIYYRTDKSHAEIR